MPDLLIGNAYGDVLVLLGNGDGTFRPYRKADQAVALAVADLTGNGSSPTSSTPTRGSIAWSSSTAAARPTVLGDQSTGLLAPGAVKLADLNGDGIPDLIVANSGSNNVLIYPGLGNGQFGPALNGGHGYFAGTNPVGHHRGQPQRPLPDLVVADKGSNDVSILLNQSQQGGAISFDAGAAARSPAGSGRSPRSSATSPAAAPSRTSWSATAGRTTSRCCPGVGGGFFNDQNPTTFAVGTDPGPIFVGNFDGKPDLVTVNAGSNDLTLISDFMGPIPSPARSPPAGSDPMTAFELQLRQRLRRPGRRQRRRRRAGAVRGGPEGLS